MSKRKNVRKKPTKNKKTLSSEADEKSLTELEEQPIKTIPSSKLPRNEGDLKKSQRGNKVSEVSVLPKVKQQPPISISNIETKKNGIFSITGLSIKDIIDLHYGNASQLDINFPSGKTATFDITNSSHTSQGIPEDFGGVESNTTGKRFSSYSKVAEELEQFRAKSKQSKNLPNVDEENDEKALYFLDNKKHKVKLWPVMIDVTNNGPLPLHINKPCRGCHRPYDTSPLGCPINYHPNIPIQSNEELTKTRKQIIKFLKENNFPCNRTDFFETEYMFCSFPCVKSYILNCLSKSPLSNKYGNALSYLTLMHKKINSITGKSLNLSLIIPCAHPLGALIDYGGHLTVEQYRESFGVLRYDETANIKRPIMFSSSPYIEEYAVK